MRILLMFLAAVHLASGQTRIMPLGDSITQGDLLHASYRYWLWRDLKQAGYDVDFVGSTTWNHGGPALFRDFDRDHEGHWGWRVDQILEQIDGWARDAKFDVVLVHLGHNDVFQGQGVSNAVDELGQLITRLRAQNPRVTVLLAQPIPSVDVPEVDALGAAIPALAEKLSDTNSIVRAADLHTGFNAQDDTYDGVHPNEQGEKKMAAGWYDALREILPPPAP